MDTTKLWIDLIVELQSLAQAGRVLLRGIAFCSIRRVGQEKGEMRHAKKRHCKTNDCPGRVPQVRREGAQKKAFPVGEGRYLEKAYGF